MRDGADDPRLPTDLAERHDYYVMKRERLTHVFAFGEHFKTAGFELLAG